MGSRRHRPLPRTLLTQDREPWSQRRRRPDVPQRPVSRVSELDRIPLNRKLTNSAWLDCMANKPQGYSRLCFLSDGITGMSCHIQVSMGPKNSSSCLHLSTAGTVPTRRAISPISFPVAEYTDEVLLLSFKIDLPLAYISYILSTIIPT